MLVKVQTKPLKNMNGQICQICGDDVGLAETGDVFVACNECAFPVCRPCYEYERKDGTQCCPQCKTRFRRHRGQLSFSFCWQLLYMDFLFLFLCCCVEQFFGIFQGVLVLKEMKMRMMLMISRMSSITPRELTRRDTNAMAKSFLLPLDMNLNQFLFSPMAIR